VPRRSAATIRPTEPDPLHRSKLVQQVINRVMLDGKKSTAERIVYDALAILAERTGNDPVEALETSIKALTPVLEVKSRRVGGATYQVPVEVPPRRARTLAVRWLIEFARNRREKSMAQRLANELLDAQSQQGGAYKRKDDTFRMAPPNTAFAHYRWSRCAVPAAAQLPREPARRLAVITCMDSRLDPLRDLGLARGDAMVLRNAGAAVSDDVERSLRLAHENLGVREAWIVAHSDCAAQGGVDAVAKAELQRGRARLRTAIPALSVRLLFYDFAAGAALPVEPEG
jgi:small subunit ribosomal protein S7